MDSLDGITNNILVSDDVGNGKTHPTSSLQSECASISRELSYYGLLADGDCEKLHLLGRPHLPSP